jgi:hypothetical protein
MAASWSGARKLLDRNGAYSHLIAAQLDGRSTTTASAAPPVIPADPNRTLCGW